MEWEELSESHERAEAENFNVEENGELYLFNNSVFEQKAFVLKCEVIYQD